MPMHDWSAANHCFYRSLRFMWITSLMTRLNAMGDSSNWFALAERAETPFRRNRITLHTDINTVRAVVEIVPAVDTGIRGKVRAWAQSLTTSLRKGVHVMVIDPFPPGRYDKHGIHRAIWENISSTEYEQPAGKPLTVASCQAGVCPTAYIEPFALGAAVPEMPLFLVEDFYVNVPLEETYQAAWDVLPRHLQKMVELEPEPKSLGTG